MGKNFRKILAIILSLGILATFCATPLTASAESADLKFGSDGKFKIVIFSDVQDQYPVHQRVLNIMRQALERENPDLVVFLGDMTEINTKDVEVDYRRTVQQILGPVVEAGVPYSIVFGNHDNQSYYSGTVTDRDDMLAVWQSIGDCRTTDPAPELTGAGTCKIPIYSSNGNDVAFNLWMVDSNSYQDPLDGGSGYDNPHADQVAWMVANNDADVNSLVFQHIPMPENYNLYVEDENGVKTYGDKKYALALKEGVTGTAGEFPATIYADDNTGEFAGLKAMGNVLGVFTGHDHLNDYSGTYDGIDLTAVPGMSYFNYGDEAIRGYGVIELDESDLNDYDYHSVKFSTLDAESGASTETTYDAYDEITYADLKQNGNTLGSEYTINGGHTFTYDVTSPSKSAIFKFRWTAGTKPGFQFSFDVGADGNISHPFGVWIKRADQVAPNGSWHLKPNESQYEVKMAEAIAEGETFDIELGRLKVLTGAPQHVGQYYVYLKVNGVLIKDGYSNTDENGGYVTGGADRTVSNEIRFGGWGNGGDDIISAVPFVEEYEAYDEIGFNDLFIGDISMNGRTMEDGNHTYTYNATSDSYSSKIKFRWIPSSSDPGFTAYLDDWVFPFCFCAKYPGRSDFGAAAGENGAWHLVPSNGDHIVQMDEPVVAGTPYDIEMGRLKVKNGPNAGKYYVYAKVNGELIKGYYYDGVVNGVYGNGTALSNKLIIASSAGNAFTATPEPETFDAYDEISFNDLFIGDTSMDGWIMQDGNHTYTYNATSSSYSSKISFRWIPSSSDPGFTAYLDDWVFPFCFCAKYPGRSDFGATAGENGAWHLVPSNGDHIVQMDEPVVAGTPYDIEMGRLKVLTGANKGKYYVYVKVNGELIKDYYYDGVVDGVYGNGTALSNKLIIASSAGNAFCDPTYVAEEEDPEPDAPYYAYDVIEYGNLKDANGNSLGNETGLQGGTTLKYNSTSPTGSTLFKFRWTVGSAPKFQMSFEKASDSAMAYRFGAWLELADAEYTNGSMWVGPAYGPKVNMPQAIVAGGTYDIEFARLKVKNGENADDYHVYLKIDGNLIAEYYVDGALVDANGNYVTGPGDVTCNVKSGEIFIAFWGSEGNKISATPVPEVYEAYDEIGFNDLYVGSISMAGQTMTSNQNYTYNATSPSYSMILKYRWIPGGDEMKFTTFLDDWVYPFCFAAKTPNQSGFGDTAGPNGSWHLVPSNGSLMVDMDEPVVAGQPYDIEIARLKVANGANAGKYYVYAKVNGELIQHYYYDGVGADGTYGSGTALSNKIIIAIPSGNSVTAVPFVEEYEAYDEIGFEDLKEADGTAVDGQRGLSGGTALYYDSTSASGSVIFKYRWKIGTVAKFQMSFEKAASDAMGYMFGAWLSAPGEEAGYPNGRMWLRPAYGPQVNLDEVLLAGTSHNVEFARLKVANGSNKGKYYVYIKIDDVLIASDYVDASVVDENGNYVTSPGDASCNVKAGEIFFAFWGSEGNAISAYKEPGSFEHEGTIGDFDGDGFIGAADLVVLRKILLGIVDTDDMPEGIADFNNDGVVDVRDLVAMKKYLAPVNSYAKPGALTLGTQEHLLEDSTKTAEYIADASATLGAGAYRLSTPIHSLYYATASNGVAVNEANMAKFEEMVDALTAKGINEILYVTDSFILPYGYADPEKNHNKTVPDPVSDSVTYAAWLKVNAEAFKALAEAFPEIKFFEPYNEPNVSDGSRLERYGIGWNATEEEQAAHKFTLAERVGIMADLCWYVSKAVKSVDAANQVTTPSLSVDTNHDHVEGNFLDELYKAIESGAYPSNGVVADKRVDNYFTIINIHSYVSYTEYTLTSQAQTRVNEWAARIKTAYDVAKAHNDGGSRIWLSETGMSTMHPDGAARSEDKVAEFISLALEKLNSELTFIDTVIFYKLADVSSDNGASAVETYYGAFRSGDDLDDPYAAKPTAEAIYSFFHNGSTDYSALDALVGRYAE